MAVTSRLPLEFIAVVGVLMVTVAIVEVPRSNMLPPERSALDGQTWRVPPEAATAQTLLPVETARLEDAELTDQSAAAADAFAPLTPAQIRVREQRVARLQASIDATTDRLDAHRAHLASAELQLLHTRALVGPLERTLLATMAMPQNTLPEILARRSALQTDEAAVVAGTRDVNRARLVVKLLARSVAARRVKLGKMNGVLAAMRLDLDRPVSLAD